MPPNHPRAFALPEVAAAVLVSVVLIALLAVSTSRSRGFAQQQGSIANLHEFATITSSYAADNADQFWGYNWNNGDAGATQYPDLQEPFTNFVDAGLCQAIDILRRRSGMPTLQRSSRANVFQYFQHLPLSDYLDRGPILSFAVSPGDRNQVLWSRDPAGFWAGAYLPNSPNPTTYPHAPFRTSYVRGAAFGGPDYYTNGQGSLTGVIGDPSTSAPPFTLGHRRVAEVTDPSRKVFMFDRAQWPGVRLPIIYMEADARVPTLLVDGSCRVPASYEVNAGFNPATPTSTIYTSVIYVPQSWDPPDHGTTVLKARAAYTRNGLRGRDIDGPEVAATP